MEQSYNKLYGGDSAEVIIVLCHQVPSSSSFANSVKFAICLRSQGDLSKRLKGQCFISHYVNHPVLLHVFKDPQKAKWESKLHFGYTTNYRPRSLLLDKAELTHSYLSSSSGSHWNMRTFLEQMIVSNSSKYKESAKCCWMKNLKKQKTQLTNPIHFVLVVQNFINSIHFRIPVQLFSTSCLTFLPCLAITNINYQKGKLSNKRQDPGNRD